ncbi:hypothetical protein QBC46DRAFT_390723 [Diplogelasinospora grovesii]|uniref:ATP synthase subunit K, mitochondrial n=1 Tax=Diplogelasinospora grovesii TaxID=303347 RepID=A0AAN6N2Z5_9PEZI|nr:hypothetical protein QBC46DRAFT_390723 [Diplogelasinospora grovesii]
MVQKYTILGQKIGSHYLAMATLGTLFGATYMMTGGSKKPAAGAAPPINASSSDEADFIKKFMESAEADEKKQKAH